MELSDRMEFIINFLVKIGCEFIQGHILGVKVYFIASVRELGRP